MSSSCLKVIGGLLGVEPVSMVLEPVSIPLSRKRVFVKLRANRQKTKDKLGPEIGFVMA